MHQHWLSDNSRERLDKINSFLLFDRKLRFLQQQQLLADRLSIIVYLKGSEALASNLMLWGLRFSLPSAA